MPSSVASTLQSQARRRAGAPLPARTKGAILLIACSIYLWYEVAEPFGLKRTYERAAPPTLEEDVARCEEGVWQIRLCRLSVAAAAYAVFCGWRGVRGNRRFAPEAVLVLSAINFVVMTYLQWEAFRPPHSFK
jgi:hypothetical protein